jgi:hypothetical protein
MAVKINVDNTVQIIRPTDGIFTIGEVHEHISKKIEPVNFDYIWLLYDDSGRKKKKKLNEIASMIFGMEIYGDVLLIPTEQLPNEWNVFQEEEQKYRPEEIDNGILMTIQKTIQAYRLFNSKDISKVSIKEEWTYHPEDFHKNKSAEDVSVFYSSVYEYISKNPKDFKLNNVIFADTYTLIKIESNSEQKKIVEDLITHFVQLEEYEKCSLLKNIFLENQ